MNPNYSLAMQLQKVLLDNTTVGDFPEYQLRMCYRLFSCFNDGEEFFITIAKNIYSNGELLSNINTKDSPFDTYFSFPRYLYFTEKLFNSALVEPELNPVTYSDV